MNYKYNCLKLKKLRFTCMFRFDHVSVLRIEYIVHCLDYNGKKMFVYMNNYLASKRRTVDSDLFIVHVATELLH